jgi:hypothetical protein
MSPEMSTKNRGSILPAERARLDTDEGGLYSRNAFEEPDDYHSNSGPDSVLH